MLLALLFFCIAVVQPSARADGKGMSDPASETVRIYPDTVTWGQPVTLSVPTEWTGWIDWAPIERCFARKIAQAGNERVRYRLYARQPGTCHWSAQQHAGRNIMPAVTINIHPHPRFQITWTEQPPASGWVRQAVRWQIQVTAKAHHDDDTSFQVRLENPWKDGLRYQFSPVDKKGRLQAISWPLLPGQRVLEGPVLVIREDGGRRWYFPGPQRPYQVRPLPMWVPQDVPVGTLTWQVDPLPAWALRDHIVRLSLKLKGEAVWPESLPWLEGRHLPDGQVEEVVFIPWRSFHWEAAHPVAELSVEWALKMVSGGAISLPRLPVLYFDPETGRLNRTVLFSSNTSPPEIYVMPAWAFIVLTGVGVMLALGMALWIGQRFWQLSWDGWLMWQSVRWQHQPEALWRSMQYWARWRNWPSRKADVLTPRQWWSRLPAYLKSRWRTRVEALEQALFGRTGKTGI